MEGKAMIGMTSGMSTGFWNPRAKYGNNLLSNLQQMPSPSLSMHSYNPMNRVAPMAPTGNQAEYPPISPTTDILSKHSILPNPMSQIQPQIDHARNPLNTPPSNQRRMGTGVIRRMF